jgi:HSP20 family molecular chaperone IbpA
MAEPIDPKEITAEFTNGVLKISIPKKEVKEAKTAKIEIK